MILFLLMNISIIQQRIKPALQPVVSMPHYLLQVSTKKDCWLQNTPETMCFSPGWHYNKRPDRISVTALMYFINMEQYYRHSRMKTFVVQLIFADVHSFTRNARLPPSFNYAQQSKTICIPRLLLIKCIKWRCKYACVCLCVCLRERGREGEYCALISCYSSNSFASACGYDT